MTRGLERLAAIGFDTNIRDAFTTAVWFHSDAGHAMACAARELIGKVFGRRAEHVWNSRAPQDMLAVQAAFGRVAMNLAHDSLLRPGADIPRMEAKDTRKAENPVAES